MNITKNIVQKLLEIIAPGIQNGAGSMDGAGNFCIQQAVSHAVGHRSSGDNPMMCVGQLVRTFGIRMNDQQWASDKARADGLRRFAVAELGSDKVSQDKFERILMDQWNAVAPAGYRVSEPGTEKMIPWCKTDKDRAKLCEMAVQALIILETEGSRYLYMTELPKSEQKKIEQRWFPNKQLTWRNLNAGAHSCPTSHVTQ